MDKDYKYVRIQGREIAKYTNYANGVFGILNIRRIKAGTEVRISYLWNKERELSRIDKNREESEKEKKQM